MISKHEALVSIAQTLARRMGKPIDEITIATAIVAASSVLKTSQFDRDAAQAELMRRYMIEPIAASNLGNRDDYGVAL